MSVGGVDWICLADDKHEWRALWTGQSQILWRTRNFLPSRETFSFEEVEFTLVFVC